MQLGQNSYATTLVVYGNAITAIAHRQGQEDGCEQRPM